MSETALRKMYYLLDRSFPNFAPLWKRRLEEEDKDWELFVSRHIEAVFGSKPGRLWEEAVEGYAEFCTEALRAQLFFEKNGHYEADNYAEVLASCYHDADYMKRRYLPGQYLSHCIWPHHWAMLSAFRNRLLPRIAESVHIFYEVGVGCGMYSETVLENFLHARGVGFDISNYALEFTEHVIASHGLSGRYETHNQDIIAEPIREKADFIICQEVLEHLEDPARFVVGLYDSVRRGGFGYITAAVNAGHTDHIYLYRSPGEVRAHVEAAGWRVIDEQIESNYPDKPIEFRPTIVGYLVVRD